jgi:hypothetical protein
MREILADGFSVAAIEDEPVGHLVSLSPDQATELEGANLLLRRGR